MSVVFLVVNFVHFSRLTQRLFTTFLEEGIANYNNLLCHTEVRCLSSGRVLRRFFFFFCTQEERVQFLENSPRKFPELHDEQWENDIIPSLTLHVSQMSVIWSLKEKYNLFLK
jgi:hypothetical protein